MGPGLGGRVKARRAESSSSQVLDLLSSADGGEPGSSDATATAQAVRGGLD